MIRVRFPIRVQLRECRCAVPGFDDKLVEVLEKAQFLQRIQQARVLMVQSCTESFTLHHPVVIVYWRVPPSFRRNDRHL